MGDAESASDDAAATQEDGEGEDEERQGQTPLELTREPFRSEFIEIVLPQRLP